MPERSGKAATSSCPLTQEILKFCLAQVVQPIFFPGKSASAWETKCHSTLPKWKTQDMEWTSRDQLLAFTWMAKCFCLSLASIWTLYCGAVSTALSQISKICPRDKTTPPLQLTCTAVMTRHEASTFPGPGLLCFTKGRDTLFKRAGHYMIDRQLKLASPTLEVPIYYFFSIIYHQHITPPKYTDTTTCLHHSPSSSLIRSR